MPPHAREGMETPSSARPKSKTKIGVAMVTTEPSTPEVSAVPPNCSNMLIAATSAAIQAARCETSLQPVLTPRRRPNASSTATPSASRISVSVAGGIASKVAAEMT